MNKSNHLDRLANITKELLKDQIDYLLLKKSLDDYSSLMLELSELDLNNENNREHINFQNGMALGTTWAALCLNDLIRTRQFVRGIFKAVADAQNQNSGIIRILYAGSGPFATLVLPLITQYSPDQLQITILEINPESIDNLKRVIKKLGVENYFEQIICENAVSCNLAHFPKIDILLSETMQHGLLNEQQVPIMLNLVKQFASSVIMIPEKIHVELALMNSDTALIIQDREQEKYKILASLIAFDKPYIDAQLSENESFLVPKKLKLRSRIKFRNKLEENYDKLALLTSIQVYKNEWIRNDASSLTIPITFLELDGIGADKKEISIDYSMDGNPKFEYRLD